MKIDAAHPFLKTPNGASEARQAAADRRAFADALGRALGPAPAAGEPGPASSLGPASISGVHFTRLPLAPSAHAAGKVEGLLDLLEGYQRQLADPRQSLKSIGPQVNRVEKGIQALENVIQKLDDDDAIKSIAQETLITATAEAFKFNRGDYNPD